MYLIYPKSNFIKARVLLIVFLICLNCGVSYGQNQFGLKFKRIRAICRTDNSFVTYNDSLSPKENIPSIVISKIKDLYKKTYIINPWRNENNNPVIFKVSYSRDIDIYIVKIYFFNGILYRLIAFNNVTKITTTISPIINGKWMENQERGFSKNIHFLENPLIYFQDINHEGKKDIIVKERAHNGDVYNAEVDHVYSLDQKMNFNVLLCIESKYLYFLNDCVINRSLKDDTIVSELVCHNNKPIIIGKVKIKPGIRVKIVDRKVYQPEFQNFLITGSGIKDETFLKRGYTFKY